jgi:hypothetical protein
MDPEDADQAPDARPPLLEDLVSLCRNLNREGARYVVIGGTAVIQGGFGRATNDIDLLIDVLSGWIPHREGGDFGRTVLHVRVRRAPVPER